MSLPAIQLNLNLQGDCQAIADAFRSFAQCIVIIGVFMAFCTCRWFNVHYVVHHRERVRPSEPVEYELQPWRRLRGDQAGL